MKTKINRFTAYSNCPPGEYGAMLTNSEVKKYPKGEREVLTFLILGKDGLPWLNNKSECYYSVIVCNKSNGKSPKSKINKIKLAMLNRHEYDPIKSRVGLPDISHFYNEVFMVRVSSKNEEYNFITHIQRPRDMEWECIEGEFEGLTTDPIKLFKQLKNNIKHEFRKDAEEDIIVKVNANDKVLLDENGNFRLEIDYENDPKMYGASSAISTIHKNLIKFLKTRDLRAIFSDRILN